MHERISISPSICHGKPVVKGTRVLVSTLLGALAGGDSIEAVLEDYPNVTREDIDAALEFASELSDFQEASYEGIGVVVIALKQPNRQTILERLKWLLANVREDDFSGRAFQLRDRTWVAQPPLPE